MNPLRQLKNERNLTFSEMCSLLGEKPEYEKALTNIVNNKRQVPAHKVIKWSSLTGIPAHLLRADMFLGITKPHSEGCHD